jgi:broad specificity phosphatase PhoE
MGPRTIILLRHGESTANRARAITGQSDAEITARGRRQARRASRYINGSFCVDRVYSSPLKRAVDTARPVARGARAAIVTDPLLVEADFGRWEGRSRETLSAESGWEDYLKDPFHFRFPGGESPQDVRARVRLFREKLFADGDWSGVVVVSHYTPITFFILEVLGNGGAAKAPFRVDNASLSIVEAGDGYELLSLLNYSP